MASRDSSLPGGARLVDRLSLAAVDARIKGDPRGRFSVVIAVSHPTRPLVPAPDEAREALIVGS
jgi:hypothetical protein